MLLGFLGLLKARNNDFYVPPPITNAVPNQSHLARCCIVQETQSPIRHSLSKPPSSPGATQWPGLLRHTMPVSSDWSKTLEIDST